MKTVKLIRLGEKSNTFGASQAKVIVELLSEGPKTRAELLQLLEGKLNTRQSLTRVLSYWLGLLSKNGIITVDRVPANEVRTATKPAAAPTPSITFDSETDEEDHPRIQAGE